MWSLLVGLSVVTAATAQTAAWGRCGGKGYEGATTCVSGYSCVFSNDWYSQCQPVNAAISPSNPGNQGNPPSTPPVTPDPAPADPVPAPAATTKAPCKPVNKPQKPHTTLATKTKKCSSVLPTSTGSAGSGPGTGSDSGTSPGTGSDTGTSPGTGAGADTSPGTGTDTGASPGTGAETGKSPSTGTDTGVSTSSAGTGPGTTLVTGYFWIRAVAAPNFHKYLQTSPANAPGAAILSSGTTAGQFAIVDGQLTQLISTGSFLYANVIPATGTGANKLAVEFKKEKSTYGTFVWSGDALQWSAVGLTRPSASAWLVCEKQGLFANLGAYGYMTPTGCSDQTIHSYNGKTADE
ncbi:uncharacterized protein RSE6_03629 [Rhynchosporium secalis]|uniref:CBM1 domain-containing protein n=1 Tax=Rhynchosporium secalis TaxID=38038 RepID=A0A1E1M381_RHYSE|nr:uncharacterized protein RSE6_03629 [Rhynchosporium secalis]